MSSKQSSKPRRIRIPLSCEPCRARKLKCNRDKPCGNCTARDEQAACVYRGLKDGTTPVASAGAMQQRIDRLEGLVKRAMAQRQENPVNPTAYSQDSPKSGTALVITPATSDNSDVAHSPRTTVISGAHSVYKGADDWYDVLREINKLKEVWSQTQNDRIESDDFHPTLTNTADGSSLLFGQVSQIDRAEILATLPPKHEVDKLIYQFFDIDTFPITIAPILHEPTFMREYSAHWKDPSQTPIIWLGLLFSILGIVMLSYHQFNEPPEYEGISESLVQLYRQRTAQCLMIGDIAKCLPYTLEALRFNATAELNRKDDSGRGLWIMSGVMVRAAINMGYHRDPSHSPTLSILQAEYRRRVWLTVITMDELASFQMGFPRQNPATFSDTMEPSNLHDWELSADTTVLPPSRPLTEKTPVTYLILKGRLFRALGRTTDIHNTPRLKSYDTIIEADTCLHETFQSFPPHMRLYRDKDGLKPLQTKSDFTNLNIEALYHHGMCGLHRKFIAKGRLDPQFNLSRERCLSSALTQLEIQKLLKPAWYKFSQTRQMLSLAAMVLFLQLELNRTGPAIDNMPSDSAVILQALERSCALWEDAKDACEEASRLSKILRNMLSNFQTTTGTPSSEPQLQPVETPSGFSSMSPSFQPINVGLSLEKDLFMMSNEMDIDWGTWDAFIEGAELEDAIVA